MKFKYVVIAVVAVFAIAGTIPANAQSERPEKPIFNIKERMADHRDNLQEKKEVRKDRVENKKEVRQDRVENRKDNVEDRKEVRQDRIGDRKDRRASTTSAFRERVTNKKERLYDRIASTTDGFRKKLGERRKNNVKNNLYKIFTRFDAAIERLNGLSDRIQSRIDKLNEDGVDVSVAQDELDEANRLIDEAYSAATAAEEALEDSIDNDEASKEAVREIVAEAKEAIKTAHAGLVESVRVLKNSQNDESEE